MLNGKPVSCSCLPCQSRTACAPPRASLASHRVVHRTPWQVRTRCVSDDVAEPGESFLSHMISTNLPPELDKAAATAAADATGLQLQVDLSRLDESDDSQFYSAARFAHHTDQGFRSRLAGLYSRHLRPGCRLLDLCSSFSSHLPPHAAAKAGTDADAVGGAGEALQSVEVVGHGMCEAELAANLQLTSYFVQDFNRDPALPLASGSMDAVLCCAGIMYLARPVKVLEEVRRVLVPGGVVILSFSSHCFADKAVAEWLLRDGEGRCRLVESYLAAAGFAESDVQREAWQPLAPAAEGDDGPASLSDPFFALVAARPQEQQEGQDDGNIGEWSRRLAAASETGGSGGAASGGGFESLASAALDAHMRMQQVQGKQQPNDAVMERWAATYKQMAEEAHDLGIPRSAIPQLPPSPGAEDVRAARELLAGMISSYMSSGL